jgi:hypothetical protein
VIAVLRQWPHLRSCSLFHFPSSSVCAWNRAIREQCHPAWPRAAAAAAAAPTTARAHTIPFWTTRIRRGDGGGDSGGDCSPQHACARRATTNILAHTGRWAGRAIRATRCCRRRRRPPLRAAHGARCRRARRSELRALYPICMCFARDLGNFSRSAICSRANNKNAHNAAVTAAANAAAPLTELGNSANVLLHINTLHVNSAPKRVCRFCAALILRPQMIIRCRR